MLLLLIYESSLARGIPGQDSQHGVVDVSRSSRHPVVRVCDVGECLCHVGGGGVLCVFGFRHHIVLSLIENRKSL